MRRSTGLREKSPRAMRLVGRRAAHCGGALRGANR